MLERRADYANVSPRQRRAGRARARAAIADALPQYERDELDLVARPLHAAPRRPRAGRAGERHGHRPAAWTAYLAFDHTRSDGRRTVELPARARARDRPRRARRASARRTCSSRPAGSCRRRCRDTRRTSPRATTPTSRATLLAAVGRRRHGAARRARGLGRHHRGDRARLVGRARPARRDADVDAGPGVADAAAVGGVHRADRRSPAGSRATAIPEYYLRLLLHSRVEDERGRLRRTRRSTS